MSDYYSEELRLAKAYKRIINNGVYKSRTVLINNKLERIYLSVKDSYYPNCI